MASIFELLNQNNERTNNQNSILGRGTTGSFRSLAGDILSSRSKKRNKSKNYLAGALLLGVGDFLSQKRMNKKYNHSCKVCNEPMFRDMRNVKSHQVEGIANWLGLCSKDCMNKLHPDDLSDLLLTGRISYLMDIQRELSTNPIEK